MATPKQVAAAAAMGMSSGDVQGGESKAPERLLFLCVAALVAFVAMAPRHTMDQFLALLAGPVGGY